MPRAESTPTNSASSRAKSVPAGSSSPPQPPHRVRLPATPAATSRPNPLDHQRSSSSSPSAKKEESAAAAAVVAASVAPPPPSSQEAAKGAGQQRAGVTRSTSASNTASLGRSAAVAEEESKAKKEKEKADKPPIDMATFEQILELDEDDPERSFSKGIVDNYHEQVESTLQDMQAALEIKDMDKLSSLGHFLKGSSAALGVAKVQASCEAMQHYGHLKDDDGREELGKEEAVARITKLVPRVRVEYKEAKAWFDNFFSKPPGDA